MNNLDARLHNERTGYPTQKPEALLERIILASSNPGELVGDFFCGSGITPLVADRLGRKFIANDGTWRAVHTTRARLVAQPSQPFQIQTLADMKAPSGEIKRLEGDARLADRTITLEDALLDELDYWEIDPAWDRKVFRSAAQAVRPRKGGTIPAHLGFPSKQKPDGGDCPVGIRLVKITGELVSLALPGDRA